jgi:hypothetical protein
MRIIGTPARQREVMERIAFGFLAVAILLGVAGIVFKGINRKLPARISIPGSGSPLRPDAVTLTTKRPAASVLSQLPGESNVVADKPPTKSSRHTDQLRPASGQLKDGFQLRSRGSVAVLAESEAGAAELKKDPGRLAELIQSGLLFSAPNHTAVAIETSHDDLLKVRILDPPMLGRLGWIRADQVTAR